MSRLIEKNGPVIVFESFKRKNKSGSSVTIRFLQKLDDRVLSIERNFNLDNSFFMSGFSFFLRGIVVTTLRLINWSPLELRHHECLVAVPEKSWILRNKI